MLSLVAMTGWAQDPITFTQGNFTYTVTDEVNKTVSIAKAAEATLSGALTIPSSVTYESVPYAVTSVGEFGFYGTGITSVTIPASIMSIGNLAFVECNSMNTITIADSENALTMSNEWGYRPFANSATTIYIGRNLTLTADANQICDNVTNVTFGDKVTTINPYIFCYNESLSSITIGEGVTSIGDNAFYWCGNGGSVKETVVEIGSESDLTSIGASAFGGCTKLKSVTLPSTLTTIGANAFDCSGLTSITIPASVTTIGNAAFQNCNSMNTITIADSENALTMSNEWGYRPFANSATTIYIGRNLTLTEDANQICDNVTNVTFGDKVTTINPYLFSGTTTITSVKVPWLTPLTLNETAFYSSAYENATLWIPGGTEAAYQNGDNKWKNFVNKNFSSYVVSITGSAHGTLAVADKTSTNGNTETMLIDRETDVVLTVTPATGYELTIFTVNGTVQTPTNGSYTVEKLLVDQTVVATFTPIAYPISYNLANGSLATANPASYTIESQAITLNNPTREGYDFAGWTGTGLNAATTSVTIAVGSTGERSYTATWTPKTYNITYTLNGGTVATANPASYTIESPAITLNNPTKTGYTFRGWKQNNEGDAMMSVVIAAGSTGNKAYTATWEVNQYTISFNSNGGSSVASITQNYGTAVVAPADPTRDGYTFGGWSPAIPSTMPAENMTLVAQWTTNHYTVSITGAGVTADNYSPEYGDDVVITIAEDEDRELTSLTVNGNNVTSAIVDGRYTINNVTSNVTVVATFNATKEFIEMAHGQRTFCCTRDLDFSGVTGIKAYIASGYNKTTGQVLLTQVESVPANTGLLLLGTEGVTYKVPYTTSDEYYVNLFQPVTEAQTVPATSGGYTNFLYGMVGGNEGFFKSSGEGTVAAGKAYLQLPTSAIPAAGKGIGLLFDDMATAIENVNSESGNDSVYDLSGRKVNADQKLTRGIYIINGKTVMIK